MFWGKHTIPPSTCLSSVNNTACGAKHLPLPGSQTPIWSRYINKRDSISSVVDRGAFPSLISSYTTGTGEARRSVWTDGYWQHYTLNGTFVLLLSISSFIKVNRLLNNQKTWKSPGLAQPVRWLYLGKRLQKQHGGMKQKTFSEFLAQAQITRHADVKPIKSNHKMMAYQCQLLTWGGFLLKMRYGIQ